MKHILRILAMLAALALCAPAALAQVTADGTVGYGESVTQLAAMGGTVASVDVLAGQFVSCGDPAVTLSLARVYAPCDGTVESIFADVGASADEAVEKYGSAMTILPESRYVIYTTAEDAYKSARAGHITSGQTVYMKCTRDGSHRGVGVITEIDGDIFIVEATGGAFHNGETVYVYMEPDYDSADRVGKGTAVATEAQGVSASGDVARLYVSAGDFVEKGQLLFETLGALPEDGEADAVYALVAAIDGYVSAVHAEVGGDIERDAPWIEICPADALVVTARVPESEVSAISVGDAATISLELIEETLRVSGAVTSVSYLPETDADGGVAYAVTLTFDPDARILPGMAATVTIE